MKVLILTNSIVYISLLRAELVQSLVEEGYKVIIAAPLETDSMSAFPNCELVDTPVDRRGGNPLLDLCLFTKYIMLLQNKKPDVVLTYTVKPNLYGGLACRLRKIPYMPNVTGLGRGIHSKGLIAKVVCYLSRLVYPKAHTVFVQNEENLRILRELCGDLPNVCMLPGSGVNLEKFAPLKYPNESAPVTFQFVARVMKEKGIDEYLEAAKALRQKYPNVVFRVIGMVEEEKYAEILEYYTKQGTIEYLGSQKDIQSLIKSCHCTVNPSYHEGMSNVLLESASSTRPVIASNIHGCKEIVDNNVTGFLCKPCNATDLTEKLEQFICLPYEEKLQMGLAGRLKVEREFDRKIVVDNYLQEIRRVLNCWA